MLLSFTFSASLKEASCVKMFSCFTTVLLHLVMVMGSQAFEHLKMISHLMQVVRKWVLERDLGKEAS